MTDNHHQPPGPPEHEENHLITERRAKLAKWRETGHAYPNTVRPDTSCAALRARYGDLDQPALAGIDTRYALAGRMMAKRVMGKIAFVNLRDASGDLQLVIQRDALEAGAFEAFLDFDIGDLIYARGRMFRTKLGELSLKAERLDLVAKCLRPLPEKYHGLTDTEFRYRRRYVDLIMNPEVRRVFYTRSRIVKLIREYFEAPGRGFLEVETPMMHAIPGGAAARPFATHHNALDLDLYLRVAPELHLKRLLVGGLEKVYEINRNFRNEGVSSRHNPEFTMLEFYWAYADDRAMMDLTEDLLRHLARAIHGGTAFDYQGTRLDFGPPFRRIALLDAVRETCPPLAAVHPDDRETLAHYAKKIGIALHPGWGAGKLLLEIFEAEVESALIQPTFVTAYPAEVSPLSRRNDSEPDLADRFELFIHGREIANGFSELNDPEDQAARFRAQAAARQAGDEEAMHYDTDYIRALEYGMPPAGGEGIGIDRLVMLLTDSASIRDVLLFPYLRPENG